MNDRESSPPRVLIASGVLVVVLISTTAWLHRSSQVRPDRIDPPPKSGIAYRGGPTAPGLPPVQLRFEQSLSWAGLPEGQSPRDAQLSYGLTPLAVQAGLRLTAFIPAEALRGQPEHLRISAPGWKSWEHEVPLLEPGATLTIDQPITLERNFATIGFQLPPGGTDYDRAEFHWLRPLDDEPGAAPPPGDFSVPLTLGARPALRLPTGCYRLLYKSKSPERIRDFAAAAALPVRLQPDAASFSSTLSLPESMSRNLVGYVGARRGILGEPPVAIFCGVQINIRKGTGEFLLVFDSPQNSVDLDYAGLRPRPDNAWPITNLFLEDPVRLSFDCPISHVDHRVVIDRSDGITTMVATPVPPEDEVQLAALQQRMKDLLKVQAQNAVATPTRFNARYRGLSAERLPNFEHLRSLGEFAKYVDLVKQGQPPVVELGDRLQVMEAVADGWRVKPLRIERKP